MIALALAAALEIELPREVQAVGAAIVETLNVYSAALDALVAGGKLTDEQSASLYFEGQARTDLLTAEVRRFAADMISRAPISSRREVQELYDQHIARILEVLKESRSAVDYAATALALAGNEPQGVDLFRKNRRVEVWVMSALRSSALHMEPPRLAWDGREALLSKFKQMQLRLSHAAPPEPQAAELPSEIQEWLGAEGLDPAVRKEIERARPTRKELLEGRKRGPARTQEIEAVSAALDAALESYASGLFALARAGRLEQEQAAKLYFEAQNRSAELTGAVAELSAEMQRLAPVSGRRDVQAKMDGYLAQIRALILDQRRAAARLAADLGREEEALGAEATARAQRVQVWVLSALRVAALNMEPRRLAWDGREILLGKFRELQAALDRA